MEVTLKKLHKAYTDHGKIIVGIDFDDTIYPYTEGQEIKCEKVRDLMKKAAPYCTFCLWTVSDKYSIGYKEFIAVEHYELPIEYINESPVSVFESRKPFFNLLLDDNAGLNLTMSILSKFVEERNIIKSIYC